MATWQQRCRKAIGGLVSYRERRRYGENVRAACVDESTRKCVVCGADVEKSRRDRSEFTGHYTDTCDPVCTRAKHAGRTRIEQFWADDEEDIELMQLGFPPKHHTINKENL
jgi:hypothetical protein